METAQTVKILGRFIVADPKVCHGQPTFRGTRIFVADVLDQVARVLDWETIIEEWHGSITHDAIAEAVHLAAQALLQHADDFVVASTASRTSWTKISSPVSGNACGVDGFGCGRSASTLPARDSRM